MVLDNFTSQANFGRQLVHLALFPSKFMQHWQYFVLYSLLSAPRRCGCIDRPHCRLPLKNPAEQSRVE